MKLQPKSILLLIEIFQQYKQLTQDQYFKFDTDLFDTFASIAEIMLSQAVNIVYQGAKYT